MQDVHQGIHQQLEQQTAKHAQRTAINDLKRYETLNQYADYIARVIIKQAGPGQGQVSFILLNDKFSIAVLLGILKAGKDYVSMDSSFPKVWTAYMRRAQSVDAFCPCVSLREKQQ